MWRFVSLFLASLASSSWAAGAHAGLPDVSVPIRTQMVQASDAAVVIGNSRYDNLHRPVATAERDADAVEAVLRDTRGIPAQRLQRLHNAGVYEMEQALRRAGRETGADGVVWVYFAGHGAAHPATGDRMLLADEARADGTAEAFASYGLTLSRARELAAAGGAQVFFLVDACYTGLGREGEDVTGGTRFVGTSAALSAARTVQWTAASSNEWATELPGAGHGAFTYALLGALRGWADGAVDGRRDGEVSLAEADRYVRRALDELGVRAQRPELVVPSGLDELVLVRQGKGRLEAAPTLPRVAARPLTLRPSRPSEVALRFDNLAVEDLDVNSLLAEQACDEAAREAVEARITARVEAEWRRMEAERRQAWAQLKPQLEACTEVKDAARRAPCVARAEAFLRDHPTPSVPVPAGTETVPTACGPRTRAVDASTRAREARGGGVRAEAEALLVQLRSPGAARAAAAPGGPWTGLRGVEVVRVAPGTHRLGAERDALGRPAPTPPVQVTLTRPYLVMTTELTEAVYREALGQPAPSPGHAKLPASGVNWFAAVRLANTLSARDGLRPAYDIQGERVRWDRGADGWRLPTEAEWEVAARGGARGDDPHGAEGICRVANVFDASAASSAPGAQPVPCSDGFVGLAPVKQFEANPLGLYDTLGNVWEWVWDGGGGLRAGTDPAAPPSELHVLRGGGYNHFPGGYRVVDRHQEFPQAPGLAWAGVRFVRDAP